MTHRNLLLLGTLLVALVTLSASAETRQRTATRAANPIIVESEIHDVSIDGDTVTLHLYRQPYEFVAPKWLRVRSRTYGNLYADDLRAGDSVHIDGDLDPFAKVITVDRVELLLRVEHRP